MRAAAPPLRILLVEDEALVAILIEDQLEELGCEVVGPAATVTRGLELCESETFDGAVLDVNLSGGERSDSVAQFLDQAGIPFVFITGYGRPGLSEQFSDVAVLEKPFTLADLRDMVERHFVPSA